jgi:hypothetical protein
MIFLWLNFPSFPLLCGKDGTNMRNLRSVLSVLISGKAFLVFRSPDDLISRSTDGLKPPHHASRIPETILVIVQAGGKASSQRVD